MGSPGGQPGFYTSDSGVGITLGQSTAPFQLGSAALFDGLAGTYVDLGLLHPGDSVTVEAWFNLAADAPAGTWHAIVARWDGSYEIDVNNADVANFVYRYGDNVFGSVASSGPIVRGTWNHLVGVFDAAEGVATLYLNGAQGTTGTVAGPLQNLGPSPDRVLIGASRSGLPRRSISKGLIAQVAVYARPLTTAQVTAHYQAGAPVIAPTFTQQPQSRTVTEGDDVSFTAAASGATAFQWRKDGVAIPGATGASYTIQDVRPSHAGVYTVVASNDAGSAESNPATLTVQAGPSFASYPEAVLADRPIHYFRFEETTGPTAADLGTQAGEGGRYTGGFTLGQESFTDRLGKALYLDGVDGSFVDLGLFHPGDAGDLGGVGEDRDGFLRDVPGGDRALGRELRTGCGSRGRGQSGHSQRQQRVWSGGDGPTSDARAVVPPGGRVREGTLSIYLNGELGGVQTIGGVLQDLGLNDPDRVMIGATRSGIFGWRGWLDEVAIYDRALTGAQIRQHFKSGLPQEEPTLVVERAIQLSWPTVYLGYVLQVTDNLESPQWQNLTATAVVEGVTYKVTVVTDDQRKYYRLHKP
ncbi:MAG: immunoglobulin domain-containing protein [Verrucomicrobia bacterium]|nr:immunoglobulin domain-containing protein [Verrucomicrobiota bacterium]